MTNYLLSFLLFVLFLTPVNSTDFPVIEEWSVESPARVYHPDNLWNAINGAAANFLRYGFEQMEFVRYMRADSVYINVEVYKHSSPENAFGIYAQERPRRDVYGAIGAQSYAEPGLVNLLTGPYYIKLSSHQTDPSVEDAMAQIARQLVTLFNQSPGLPGPLAWFPAADKVLNSEQYIDRNFLDRPEFRGVFQADYSAGSNTLQLFIIPFNSTTEAHAALATYFEKTGTRLPISADAGPFEHINPNYGPILWLQKGSFLVGAMNYTSRGKSKKLLLRLSLTLP